MATRRLAGDIRSKGWRYTAAGVASRAAVCRAGRTRWPGLGRFELPEPEPELVIEEDDLRPSWIEPYVDDDQPTPQPDPWPLNQPAASAADRFWP